MSWQKIKCALGFHGKANLRTTQRMRDYYHDTFTTTCTKCGRVVWEETLYGDWG